MSEKEPGLDPEDFEPKELEDASVDLLTDIYMGMYASFIKVYKTEHSEEEVARMERDYQEFIGHVATLAPKEIRSRFPENIFAKLMQDVLEHAVAENEKLRESLLSDETHRQTIEVLEERAKDMRKRRKN